MAEQTGLTQTERDALNQGINELVEQNKLTPQTEKLLNNLFGNDADRLMQQQYNERQRQQEPQQGRQPYQSPIPPTGRTGQPSYQSPIPPTGREGQPTYQSPIPPTGRTGQPTYQSPIPPTGREGQPTYQSPIPPTGRTGQPTYQSPIPPTGRAGQPTYRSPIPPTGRAWQQSPPSIVPPTGRAWQQRPPTLIPPTGRWWQREPDGIRTGRPIFQAPIPLIRPFQGLNPFGGRRNNAPQWTTPRNNQPQQQQDPQQQDPAAPQAPAAPQEVDNRSANEQRYDSFAASILVTPHRNALNRIKDTLLQASDQGLINFETEVMQPLIQAKGTSYGNTPAMMQTVRQLEQRANQAAVQGQQQNQPAPQQNQPAPQQPGPLGSLTPEAMRAAGLAASGLQGVTTGTQPSTQRASTEPSQRLLVTDSSGPQGGPQQTATAQKYNVQSSAMLA